MCVFSAVIKPALGNIIRRGGVMENYLIYGIVILGIIGVVLNIALILVYVIELKKRSEWLLEEVDELNKLPLIIQAKKEQTLRRLNQEQAQTQKEIERLSR